ncbi:MAG: hypothetical protein ABI399_07990 [Bauldia sp.]
MTPTGSGAAEQPSPAATFVLTADLDWASEYCIEHFLSLARRFSVRPTLFVTHESAAARKAEDAGLAELAIHPNFLPGSSHGSTPDAVVDHVMRLVPAATVARNHRYLDTPAIRAALAGRGLRYDSNAIRHLEAGLGPVRREKGLLQLPVFFEDDVHWRDGLAWTFAAHSAAFFSAGLKILNFHPFFVALNAPDASFYERHKAYIPTLTAEEAASLRHPGAGAGTFLVETLAAIQAAGCRFVTLGELVGENPAWQDGRAGR